MRFKPEDHDNIIGQRYRKDGFEYTLTGIMYDIDDYHWVLMRGPSINKHTQLLGCVCSIEMYGYEKIDQ